MYYFKKNKGPKYLRKLLNSKKTIPAPGCFDSLSARVIEEVGFEAVYITGHGISVSLLGQSDLGLTNMTDVISRARDIISTVTCPVLLDIDTGYGGPLNIQRTIMEAERSGVSAVQIEDQKWPKKCGHMEGKRVISSDEMIKKIAAAKAAIQDGLVIIARTDARAVFGINEAIKRANMYLDAGADIAFIDGPESLDDLEKMAKGVHGWLVANYVEGGKTPLLTLDKYEKMGFKLVIYPLSLMYASVKAMEGVSKNLKEKGSTEDFANKMFNFNKFNNFIGLSRMYEIEKEYTSQE